MQMLMNRMEVGRVTSKEVTLLPYLASLDAGLRFLDL